MESSLPPFGHVPPSAVEAAAAFSESEFRKRGTLASVQPRTDASGMASYFHLTDSKKPPLRRAAKSRLQDCARARARRARRRMMIVMSLSGISRSLTRRN